MGILDIYWAIPVWVRRQANTHSQHLTYSPVHNTNYQLQHGRINNLSARVAHSATFKTNERARSISLSLFFLSKGMRIENNVYKILLTASIKSVWAGSGPYCSDAVRAPFTFHTQICIRRHQHTTRNHKQRPRTFISHILSSAAVLMYAHTYTSKYTHCEYYIHLYQETAAQHRQTE